MAELRLSEVTILKQFLEDHNGRIALKAFFANRAAYHRGKAVSYLCDYQQQDAQEHAFFANCYEKAFSDLEEFCNEQIRKGNNGV